MPCNSHSALRTPHFSFGFTLIELLMVVMIVGVLVVIVVGVTSTVRQKAEVEQTKVTMKVILGALADYCDAYNQYPYDDDPNTYKPTDANAVSWLYQGLTDANSPSKCRDKLSVGLPAEAVGATPDATSTPIPRCFLDAFGGRLLFSSNRARGGGPLLISAGPDGYYGPPYKATTYGTDPNRAADNIYSDGR